MAIRVIVCVCIALITGALCGTVEYSISSPVVVSGPGMKAGLRLDRCALISGKVDDTHSEVCLVGTKTAADRPAAAVVVSFGESGKLFACRTIADICANPCILGEYAGESRRFFDDGERCWSFTTNGQGIVCVGWQERIGCQAREVNVLRKDITEFPDSDFLPEIDGVPLLRAKGGILSLPGIDNAVDEEKRQEMTIKDLRKRMKEEDERQAELDRRPRGRCALYYGGGESFRIECRITSEFGDMLAKGCVSGRIDFERAKLMDMQQMYTMGGNSVEVCPKYVTIGSGDVLTVGIRVMVEFGEYRYATDFLIR